MVIYSRILLQFGFEIFFEDDFVDALAHILEFNFDDIAIFQPQLRFSSHSNAYC